MEDLEKKQPRKVKIPLKWVLYAVLGYIILSGILPIFKGTSTFQGDYMDVKVDSPPDTPVTFQEPEPYQEGQVLEVLEPVTTVDEMLTRFFAEPNWFFIILVTIPFLIIVNRMVRGFSRW